MGLGKSCTSAGGMAADYWKISRIVHNRLANITEAMIVLYKDSDAEGNGFGPVSQIQAETQFYFADESVNGMTVAQCYVAIKADAKNTYFSDATDN